ncbi:alpha/beta fold hydrolase [Frigidibacter albus]|uniref:Alpha/beta fold hydrolase n=1 Tax=Frigidibacter albus TaxID=1465486 RepID=A0A6L8VFH7_9RHOB|nr:alpha/beta hydrolase [Frigidibacter albus]MZQ88461.1 alpha/beta fold hydrolase [Frigidibacter albus]NBE30730.1 alpha/beta fold hydrolase [Frigidibacter albus]GGH48417.1 hydrolase [Frigidibacter albus]
MERFEAEDGTRLAYRDEGAGLPLLALAGLTRDGRDFDYLARYLPDGIRLIRLDSRGRGRSDWAPPETYSVAQEAKDALALLDHLGIARAAVIGSSRGGLLGLVIAATARPRLLGLCMNDVGPVVERDGLVRIGSYIGVEPTVPTLEEVADRTQAAMPGFDRVPPLRWQEETVRHYVQLDGHVGLTYDPALRTSFEAAMAQPLPELWPLFDACAGLPLALIRGEASDVLARATAAEMRRRRPDMLFAEVPWRGHIPFLDEPAAISVIVQWLARVQDFDAAAAPAPLAVAPG